ALQAALFQLLQILAPQRLLVLAKPVEVLPRIDAGVVEIVELDLDSVIADGLELENADMHAAGDDLLLRRAMALHLGRGAFDAQEFRWIGEMRAVVEIDLEALFRFLEADLRRPMLRAVRHRRG